MKKRQFLKLTSVFAAGTVAAPMLTFCSEPNAAGENGGDKKNGESNSAGFTLPALPYAFDALEPHIDALTMEIHHGKHHQGYTDGLNKALKNRSDLKEKSIESLMKAVTAANSDIGLRNNGGGYYNHSLFWEIMSPEGGGTPGGAIAEAIDGSFGSFEAFKEKFSEAAGSVFGSGWAWLCAGEGSLFISTTPNQDNPLMTGIVENTGTPILGIDVWEHAYYLNHQNERGAYIDDFFEVINWDAVNARLEKA
ncbi:MAG: superoxide dismutase [Cryomorphaceae bacterium]|nr:superoxide dismutase [Flavobacteriales bacterium]